MSAPPRIRVRPGRPEDLDALYALASAGGVGLTNLPADRPVLQRKLEASARALNDAKAREAGAAVLLFTEMDERIVGTASIFPRVGAEWPFCSYRITRQAATSRAVGRANAQRLLNLVHDFDGEVEVGGLFIDPTIRGAALGGLTARSRYLFLALHRSWFGRRAMAELRGWQDDAGRSPVWEALGRHFYDMDFEEADRINGVEGNQFIADLGPRFPIYISILPRSAQAALGRPHDDGRRALAMLMQEGFRDDGYVDIFDGGPTVFAEIDDLRTVRESLEGAATPAGPGDAPGAIRLIATGEAERFRATAAPAFLTDDGGVRLGPEAFDLLEIAPGARVRHAPTAARAIDSAAATALESAYA